MRNIKEHDILALDLSTAVTGWALFSSKGLLKECGVVKSSWRGLSKLFPLHAKLKRMENLADKVLGIAEKYAPDLIVIEEIAGSKNRLGQKSLDIFHGITIQRLLKWVIRDGVRFQDVGGMAGWRPFLNIKLSDEDKKHNRKARREGRKKDVVGWKDLSCRFVNKRFNMVLDPRLRKSDGDIADAVCVGLAYLVKQQNGQNNE